MRRGRAALGIGWMGRALVVVVVAAVAWELATTPGGGVSRAELGASWQLVDLRVLGDDPLGSVWYLHTQPPLHNLLVGVVLWLPVPVAGTLFALYTACLLACGLLLHDLLVRWRVGPLAAGIVAGLAVANPAVLDTIHHASYELPVATLLVGTLWAAQRHLQAGADPWAGGKARAAARAAAHPDAADPLAGRGATRSDGGAVTHVDAADPPARRGGARPAAAGTVARAAAAGERKTGEVPAHGAPPTAEGPPGRGGWLAEEPGCAGVPAYGAPPPTGEGPPGRGGWLLLAAVLLTLGCLTRSLLHPVWLAGALALLLAARPVRRGTAVAALLIPLLLLGGWMGKNQVLFGTPSLSSWLGFNLQRGVVAPMERHAVRAAVRDGAVSPLATRQPWGELEAYGSLADGCAPRHDHLAAAAPTKTVGETGLVVANFNHECYLPLYGQASDDAAALARRYPGRYLRTRASALTLSFASGDTCGPRGCTWMDALYGPLLGRVGAAVSMGDWNLPLPGASRPMRVDVSLTLVAAAAAVTGRGAAAAARLARRSRQWRRNGGPPQEERPIQDQHRDEHKDQGMRQGERPSQSQGQSQGQSQSQGQGLGRGRRGRRGRSQSPREDLWPAEEVLWLLAAWTVAVVVVGGDLVELGENGRFRAAVDPLLVALPLGALARRLGRVRRPLPGALVGPLARWRTWFGPGRGRATAPVAPERPRVGAAG